ncbi:LPXTG cell wall anchor domain-containing protein [Listeria monocytogenes]|nr:LPXTG cell wall anchor domain-containing protein [Listeria monocytogenes]
MILVNSLTPLIIYADSNENPLTNSKLEIHLEEEEEGNPGKEISNSIENTKETSKEENNESQSSETTQLQDSSSQLENETGRTVENIFPDSEFARYMADKLTSTLGMTITVDSVVTQEQLNQVKNIFVSATYNINNIEGIQYLPNIEWLELVNQNVSDISMLTKENCANLWYLNLSGNPINDFMPIADLDSLIYLYLAETGMSDSDLTALSNLNNIQYLYLSSNVIENITTLTTLNNLKEVYISSNKIKDVTPLAQIDSLEYISIGSNQISDISPLNSLTNLRDRGYDATDQTVEMGAVSYKDVLNVKNQIIGVEGNIVTPYLISDAGSYDNEVVTWTCDPMPASVYFYFSDDNGDAPRSFDGTVMVNPYLDEAAPVITASPSIDYLINTSKSDEEFLKDVKAVTDDQSPISSDLQTQVDFSEIGSYYVTLTSTDSAGNQAVPVSVIVNVKEPMATLQADAEITYSVDSLVSESEFLKDVHASTEVGNKLTSNFDAVVDFSTQGDYEVIITASNSTNSVDKRVVVHVVKGGSDGYDMNSTTPNDETSLKGGSKQLTKTTENKLPKTGDDTSISWLIVGIVIAIASISLLKEKKKVSR